jgi:SAM-dependent methyltransferase
MRSRLKTVALFVLLTLSVAALTLPIWKPAAKRFKYFVVATNVYQDLLRRTGLRHDQISQPDYSALPETAIPTYLNRINTTFADYQKYGGLSADRLRGRHVLEVGPGETIGVALRFIGAGAESVTAVDKFVPLQTSTFHRRLYHTLEAQRPADESARMEAAVDLTNGVAPRDRKLTYVYGEGMEVTARRLRPASVDVIVSNAVLEEIYDSDTMFAGFDRLLKPGGRQVHVIDLGDYGMFSKHGFHPLEFLTIPDGIYRYMVEASGQPNRRGVDYYRRTAARFGYSARIYRTWVVGGREHLREYPLQLQYGRDYSDENLQLVRSVRSRLLSRYRELSDEDLLTRSILLVLDKPVSTGTMARQ